MLYNETPFKRILHKYFYIILANYNVISTSSFSKERFVPKLKKISQPYNDIV